MSPTSRTSRSLFAPGWAAAYFGLVLTALVFAAPPATAQDIQWTAGPVEVELGDGLASLDLPADFAFADAAGTQALLEAMGNQPSGDEIGLVVPQAEDKQWFLIFEYEAVGFVKDDDQHEIDAEELFETIDEATEASNGWRRENGFGALHVSHWEIEPYYDDSSHHLKWALAAAEEGGGEVVNFNERLLGRRGVVSVTLVTDPATFSSDRLQMSSVLDGFEFQQGNRYADFVSGDKVASFGLAALVAGGAGAAAVKLGLFAVLGKFLAKAWKLLVVGVVALGAGLRRIFGGGDTAESEV